MRKDLPDAAIAAIVVGTTLGIAFAVYVICLFTTASGGEQLNALTAIFGGLIGAAGAAIAVYLTLAGQRKDEAQKVEGALIMEVAEFARMAFGALSPFENVLTKKYINTIPLRDLPALTAMPEPIVYKATADRLSRLPYGSLFVSFHTRIAEARQLANMLAVAAPTEIRNGTPATRMLDDSIAKTLGTAWYDICSIARSILRKEELAAKTLIDAAVLATLKELDSSWSFLARW
jgi:hypothetical protein